MKILHVYRTYFPDPPGGMQEAIRQICISTQKYGIHNTVFALSPNPKPQVIERPEARVIRRRSWAAPASCDLGSADAFTEFNRLVHEVDLVHYYYPWPFADILNLFASKKPSVLTYVSDIVRQIWLGNIYKPLMRKTLLGVDAIVANSPKYAESSKVLSGSSIQSKLRIIPLGINQESDFGSEDKSILDHLALDTNEPYFLFIGVFRYYKGLSFLLEAADRLPAKIVIAGTGPEEQALHQLTKKLRLTNIIFAGQVTDAQKAALLKRCRALILPSHLRSEAYGMVLVEASMYGKPMISCEIGTGTSYVNSDGETGFVVPPESASSLRAAMLKLLDDDALVERFGAAARKRYEELFSGDALGKSYVDLYRDVIDGHTQR